jgi:hypothetical protein
MTKAPRFFVGLTIAQPTGDIKGHAVSLLSVP